MSHVHHHHHGPPDDSDGWEELAGAPVRTLLMGIVGVLAVATLVGLAIWWPRGEEQVNPEQLGFANRVDATVVDARIGPCTHDPAVDCNATTIEITEGDEKGATTALEFEVDDNTPASQLEVGDDIVLDDAGSDIPDESRYAFADVQRGTSLWILAALFAVAVVALGRLRGLLALFGIVVSLGVLLAYVFPALLHGVSPLGVALTGASIIAFATLYLAHGVNERTTVALLGTMASLLLTAGLAAIFASMAQLSGLASEESVVLLNFAPGLDFRGLLLAAVIIGTLGVLDDVTITQVSAVWELHHSDRSANARQLYARGIRIGRDHIASTVNTLVLAYTAAALPLLLLFTQSGLALGDVLATETVAVEVVQTLVGSIGLVASVPLTTALASWVVTRAAAEDREPYPLDPFDPRAAPSDGGW
ncbi:MAG TPA: YibE/F family protein [Acidimicrobiales bacterium]|nr:YibE/F family protein [Acidimicrobiales bacterium]